VKKWVSAFKVVILLKRGQGRTKVTIED